MLTKIVLAFNSAILVFLLSPCAVGQARLEDKKITIHLERAAFAQIIEVLIQKYDVPISFEQSLSITADEVFFDFNFEQNIRHDLRTRKGVISWPEQDHHVRKYWFNVSVVEARLGDVLDHLVTQMPDYKWEINDGVVNILPTKNRDEMFRKLLDLEIENFHVDQNYIFLIGDALLSVPELKKFVDSNGFCTANLDGLNPVYSRRKLAHDFRFSNLTLFELLNKITQVKRGGWILRRYRPENRACINIQI